jgi:hypothetical protein
MQALLGRLLANKGDPGAWILFPGVRAKSA